MPARKSESRDSDPQSRLWSAVLRRGFEKLQDTDLTSQAAPNLGDTRYDIIRRIGHGGMGVVYAAWDRVLEREVAIKVLRQDIADLPGVQLRFRREARIAARLQHPNIVPVFDVSPPDATPLYYAMKLVCGRTMAWILERSDLPARDLVDVFLRICQGMACAHERNIIHRDLKPSNIMCGEWGEVQIIDWGLAKALGEADTADVESATTATREERIGTPGYMAPEQHGDGHATTDRRADVFALGRLLNDVLRDDTAPELRALAEWCVSPNPEDRPASAGIVAERVAEHLATAEQRAIDAVADALSARHRVATERRARRRITTASVATVVALLGLGWVAWLLSTARETRHREARSAVTFELAAGTVALERCTATAWSGADDTAIEKYLHSCESHLAIARRLARALPPDSSRDRDRLQELQSNYERLLRHRAMLLRLRQIRDAFALHASAAVSVREYEAAFRDYGISVATHDPAVARIRDARIRDDLIEALLAWSRYLRLAKGPAARVRAMQAIAEAADDNSWRVNMIRTLRAKPDDAVLEKLAAAPSLAAGDLRSLIVLGNSLAHRGKKPLALVVLSHAVDRDPGDFRARLSLGVVHAAQPEPDGPAAVLAYECALAIEPESALARVNLGNVIGARNPEAGRECYEKAIRSQPNVATGHYHLGLYYDRKGDTKRALASYKRCADLDPIAAHAHYNSGLIYLSGGEHAKAITAFESALAIQPDHATARGSLGQALQVSKGFAAALSSYATAADDGWWHFEMHRNLGNCLANTERPADAAIAFRDAHVVATDPLLFVTWRIRQLIAAGAKSRATILWWELVATAPDDERVLAAIPDGVLPRGEDIRELIRQARTAVGPRFASLPAPARAHLLAGVGRPADAVETWREWIRARGDSVSSEDLLAAIECANQHRDEAQRDAWLDRGCRRLARRNDISARREARIWRFRIKTWTGVEAPRSRLDTLADKAHSPN